MEKMYTDEVQQNGFSGNCLEHEKGKKMDMKMKIRRKINRIKYFLGLLIMFSAFGVSKPVMANASEAYVDLEIMQTITATNTDRTDLGCNYTLTAETEAAPMPEGSDNGKLNFTMSGEKASQKLNFSFKQTGEYHYQLKRDSAVSETGYTYDETVYNIVVFADYYNGTFSAEVKVHRGSSEDKVPKITFQHNYKPTGVCEIDPPVKKVVEGEPEESSIFKFTLTAADKSNPMPVGSEDGVKTIQIKGSGEKEFGMMNFTAPGKYYYTISEVDTGESGYTYDKMSYTLKCIVVDDNGFLKFTKTMTDASGNETSVATFTNTYKFSNEKDTENNTTNNTPDNTSKTHSGSTSKVSGKVKTGDNTDIICYVAVLIISMSVLVFGALKKRKNDR